MTLPAKHRIALAASLLLLFSGVSAPDAQMTTSKPIKIKAPKPKKEKFKGEVLVMTRLAVTVRDRENYNLVRTFSFDEKLAPKMAEKIDRNQAFPYGHPIEVEYTAGTDTAVKIKEIKPRFHRRLYRFLIGGSAPPPQ